MMLLFGLTGLAFALEPTLAAPVAGPAGLADVAIGDDSVIFLLGSATVEARQPDGALLDSAAIGGARLLLADLDGDGDEDLLVCGDAGVWSLPWTGSFGASVVLSAEPCAAIVATDLSGARGFATAGEALFLWSADGSGARDLGLSFSGAPLLAARTDAVCAANSASADLAIYGPSGLSSLATGGPVGAVAVVDDLWTWTSADAPLVQDELGATRALSGLASELLQVDLDEDGTSELVVAYVEDNMLGILDASSETLLPLDAAPGRMASADLDGDGCEDVAITLPDLSELAVLYAADCPSRTDGDYDGVSAWDGDCDDTMYSVNPGAREQCDGLDNDCDGVVDNGPVSLVISATRDDGRPVGDAVDEGSVLLISAEQAEGCAASLAWTGADSSVLNCSTLDEQTQFCALRDDGLAELVAVALDEHGGELGRATFSVEVRNVAPSISGGDFGQDTSPLDAGSVRIHVDEYWDGVLYLADPGADPLTLSVTDGPPCLHAYISGWLSCDADEEDRGIWDAAVIIDDGDGGQTSLEFTFVVLEAVEEEEEVYTEPKRWHCGESGCGLCGSGNLMFLGVLLPALRRRRKDRSET